MPVRLARIGGSVTTPTEMERPDMQSFNSSTAWWRAVACGVVLSAAVTWAQGAPRVTADLGPEGEIPVWLVLGYLEGVQPLDTGRLPGTEEEGGIQVCEGDVASITAEVDGTTVECELTWKRAEPHYAEMRTHRARLKRLNLFMAPDGTVIENAEAYVYCEIRSPEKQTVDLMAGALWGFNDLAERPGDRSLGRGCRAFEAYRRLPPGSPAAGIGAQPGFDSGAAGEPSEWVERSAGDRPAACCPPPGLKRGILVVKPGSEPFPAR